MTMGQWEYKVVPTPRRPKKAKGVKGDPDRFAYALAEAINEVAAEGWEFVKTETLPMESKPGVFKARVEVFQTLMFFRRPVAGSEVHEDVIPQMPPGIITPVTTATAGALTAERYVPPIEDNSVSPEPMPEMPPETDADFKEPEVEFDAGNIDPLKKVVEANRSRG